MGSGFRWRKRGIEVFYDQTSDIGLGVQLDIIHFSSFKRLLNNRAILISDRSFKFRGTTFRAGKMTRGDYSPTLYADVVPIPFFD